MNTVKQIQCHSLKSHFSARFVISNLVDTVKCHTTPQSELKQHNMPLGAILSCSLKCLHVFFGLSWIIKDCSVFYSVGCVIWYFMCSTALDVF